MGEKREDVGEMEVLIPPRTEKEITLTSSLDMEVLTLLVVTQRSLRDGRRKSADPLRSMRLSIQSYHMITIEWSS